MDAKSFYNRKIDKEQIIAVATVITISGLKSSIYPWHKQSKFYFSPIKTYESTILFNQHNDSFFYVISEPSPQASIINANRLPAPILIQNALPTN